MYRLLLLLLVVLLPTTAVAQVTGPTYVFVDGTVAVAAQVNTNFSDIYAAALNRNGGTMLGTLNVQIVLPDGDNTRNLGSAAFSFASAWFDGTVTLGVLTATGQTHSVSNADTGFTSFSLRNTTGGTGNGSRFRLGNDADADVLDVEAYSASFTIAGAKRQNGALINAVKAGGLSIAAQEAGGDVRIYAGGVADADLSMTLFDTGGVTIGDTTDPGSDNLRVAGTVLALAPITGTAPATGGTALSAASGAFGAGSFTGAGVTIGRNTSGSGAAGYLGFVDLAGDTNYVWADNSGAPGVLRISTAPPKEDSSPSDVSGTIVGDQTSWHTFKDILRVRTDAATALAAVVGTPVYDFTYRRSTYLAPDGSPAVFTGLVGYNRSDWFMKAVGPQQTPALNEVNVAGFLTLSIQELERRLRALERNRR